MADQEKAEKKEAKKDKKKKRGKAGLLIIILLALLLIGLGLNFGRGGIGGLLPGSASAVPEQQPAPVEPEQPTPETKAPDAGEKTGPYVIVVGEEIITLDDVEVKLERLPEAVGKLPAGAEVIVKNEHALVTQYSNVKKILEAAGVTYSEEYLRNNEEW